MKRRAAPRRRGGLGALNLMRFSSCSNKGNYVKGKSVHFYIYRVFSKLDHLVEEVVELVTNVNLPKTIDIHVEK